MLSSLRENFRRTKHAFKHATATPPKVITISVDGDGKGKTESHDSPTTVTSNATIESPTTVASDASPLVDDEEWVDHRSSLIMKISAHTDSCDSDSNDGDSVLNFVTSNINNLYAQSQPPPDLKLQIYCKRNHKLCKSYLVHKDIVALGPRGSLRIADLCDANAGAPSDEETHQPSYAKNLEHTVQWAENNDDESSDDSLFSTSSTSASGIIELNEQQAKIVPQLLNFIYFYKSGNTNNRSTKDSQSAKHRKIPTQQIDSPTAGCAEGNLSGEMLVNALKVLYESAIIFQIPQLQSVVTYELFNDEMLPLLTVQMAVNIIDFIVLEVSPLKPPSMLEEDDPLLDSTIQFLARNLVKYAAGASEISASGISHKNCNDVESTTCVLPPQIQTLATTIEPVFLLQILHENQRIHNEALRLDGINRSKLIVHCVYNYYNQHKLDHQYQQNEKANRKRLATMTKEILHKLTDEELIGYISPHFDAPVFLLAESKLRPKEPTQKVLTGSRNSGQRRRRHGLSRLEKRCIQSITSDWKCCYKEYCTTSSGLLEFLHKLPTVVLMELFMATSVNANNFVKQNGEESCEENSPDGQDIDSKLSEKVTHVPSLPDDLFHQRPLTRYRLIDMILQLVMDQVIPKTSADY